MEVITGFKVLSVTGVLLQQAEGEKLSFTLHSMAIVPIPVLKECLQPAFRQVCQIKNRHKMLS